MKALFLNDVHLDFLDEAQVDAFLRELVQHPADCVLLGGDISIAKFLGGVLQRLADTLRMPVYFVLGNHDFYGSDVASVRDEVRHLAAGSRSLRYLNECGVLPLTARTSLIGHDGWGDARLGNVINTGLRLNDFAFIKDLTGLSREERIGRLRQLGDEAAAHIATHLPAALDAHEHVVVLTHVPPFREAAWHEGAYSDDDWLPYFTCKAMGDVLLRAMKNRPDRRMTVLCGHTHGGGVAKMLPNLTVYAGEAEYRHPRILEFEFD